MVLNSSDLYAAFARREHTAKELADAMRRFSRWLKNEGEFRDWTSEPPFGRGQFAALLDETAERLAEGGAK